MKKIHPAISALLTAVMLVVFTQANAASIAECQPAGTPPNPHDGITHAVFQNGLCFPSFNNYVDSNDTYTPNEIDFFKARIVGPGTPESAEQYRNSVEVRAGQIIKFVAYVHNDGNPAFNPLLAATNVKTRVDSFSPFGGEYLTPASPRLVINQFITADNTIPNTIQDGVTIVSSSGNPIQLKYIFNPDAVNAGDTACDPTNTACKASAKFALGPKPNTKYRYFMREDFFGNGASFGSPDTNTNIYFASEDYRGYIYFEAQVVEVIPPAPLPTLTLVKNVDNSGAVHYHREISSSSYREQIHTNP